MCKCAVKKEKKSRVVTVKNSWRLRALYRIEKYIREVGQDARAKRMGICGNTIFVKVKKGDPSNVLYDPQVRCKDRVCPVCNSYRASILSRKVEELGKGMETPHLLTITANELNRDSLKTAVEHFKKSTNLLKKERSWWEKVYPGRCRTYRNYIQGRNWLACSLAYAR